MLSVLIVLSMRSALCAYYAECLVCLARSNHTVFHEGVRILFMFYYAVISRYFLYTWVQPRPSVVSPLEHRSFVVARLESAPTKIMEVNVSKVSCWMILQSLLVFPLT